MEKHELVIVGGSAGGIQAAICAQKHHGLEDILVIRMEEKVPVPCGIPYIFGTLGAVSKNIIPDKILGEAKLKIGEVVAIDRNSKTVKLKSGEEIGYNKLVLATGSSPLQPPVPGIDKKGVWFAWKNTDYLERLAEVINGTGDIVVIGGGFIGLEFADECRKRGHKVTVVELLEHCLQLVCNTELCIRAEESLRSNSIELITGDGVKSIDGTGKAESVTLQSGKQIKCDLVVVGIGVKPNVQLAENAGLEIGTTGGIKVDEFQRTTDGSIFAVGDCAEKYSFFNGAPTPLRLASIATREGKIAAANLFQPQWRNVGTIGVFSTVLGNTAIAVAGLTEAKAREMGYEIIVGEAEAASKHPGTMPEAHPMRVRLAFCRRSGKIVGGCACCTHTVGEVANIIAAAIVNGMTMEQIAMFPMGTHPWLTASPLAYQITDAASNALHKVKNTANAS
ncbi:MAG: FAD-dependent oxidoreductase [Dehalococcoidales bacterium]|nr:FAD-dependent oxidoreductase [Dehalococcoidales bacterium]